MCVHMCARKKRLCVGKWRSNDSLKCSLWCNLLAAPSSFSCCCCQRWEWFSWWCCCCSQIWGCFWWSSYQQITTSWLLVGTMFITLKPNTNRVKRDPQGPERPKSAKKREKWIAQVSLFCTFPPGRKIELRLNRFITELRSEYDGVVGVLAPLFYRALPPLFL